MFGLSGYLKAPHTPTAADLQGLKSRVYRFRGSTPDLRLPKDPSGLAPLLAAPEGDAAWSALSAPQGRVPLCAPEGCRRVALVTAIDEVAGVALARVTLTVVPPAGKHGQPVLADATIEVARGRDAQLGLLTCLWEEADPAARTASGGVPAVWLGNDPGKPASSLPATVQALGAAYGLDVEVVRDARRRSREVGVRLAKSPPAYVFTWMPHAVGCEAAVASFEAASEEGEVLVLLEREEADVLVEFALLLDEHGFADPSPDGPPAVEAPKPGEERFFIKGMGSKVGDVMIAVLDCGHGQWGSDARRKAPRAYKGIWAQQGVRPTALFKCKKCSKNRWRARW